MGKASGMWKAFVIAALCLAAGDAAPVPTGEHAQVQANVHFAQAAVESIHGVQGKLVGMKGDETSAIDDMKRVDQAVKSVPNAGPGPKFDKLQRVKRHLI